MGKSKESENKEGEIKVGTRTVILHNETTGKYAGKRVEKIILNPQDLSIDEAPPPGLEGVPLSKTPPLTMGGVTAAQIEQSKAGKTSGIEESQPKGDKD